jgi:hypothetical protein
MHALNNFVVQLPTLLAFCVLLMGFCVTVWQVANKYRIWEKYDYRYSHKYGERCMLCIPFWFCVLIVTPIAIAASYWLLFLAPFIVAGPIYMICAKW